MIRTFTKYYRRNNWWSSEVIRPFKTKKKLIDWPVGAGCPTKEIERDLGALYVIKDDRRENQRQKRIMREALIFRTRGVRLV